MTLVVVALAFGGCRSNTAPGGGSLITPVNPADNKTCVAFDRPVPASGVALEVAFPNLDLSPFFVAPDQPKPVSLQQAPGDDSRWFFADWRGRIFVFENRSDVTSATIFGNISDRVAVIGEGGMLGMAFHPDFATNGQVFLSYTRTGSPVTSYISRFTSHDGLTLDPTSEEVILTLNQPFPIHNLNQIAFGPDGFLYAGAGDGGSENDILGNAQNTNNLFGAMLRIDVDGSAPYGIPADNPFASGQGGRPEIFAWGFRNPWRWSFDSLTGDLWAGDVGGSEREEINYVVSGHNYGWNLYEGSLCRIGPCGVTGLTAPEAEYSHAEGNAVVGGYVYRGSAIPGLYGTYVYADIYSGRIWSLNPSDETVELLYSTAPLFTNFAQDIHGEIYIPAWNSDRIYRLVPQEAGSVGNVPKLLSESGCADPNNVLGPAAGMVPYQRIAQHWTDGTETRAWFALPQGKRIKIQPDGAWALPPGSVLVKHFNYHGRRIETRLLVHHTDGVWSGYSYEWNEAQADASYVPDGKTVSLPDIEWTFPSGPQCNACHNSAASYALGLNTAQLNRTVVVPWTGVSTNQITALSDLSVFENPLTEDPESLPRLSDPLDGNLPIASRARTYLKVNCAFCHRPGGPTPVDMDLRNDVDLIDLNVCGVPPQSGNLGITDALRVSPGEPDRSVLVKRMSLRDEDGMPPLGSHLVDDKGLQLVREWIAGLTSCP